MSNPDLRIAIVNTSLLELSKAIGADVSRAKQIGHTRPATPVPFGGISISYVERHTSWSSPDYSIDWNYALIFSCASEWGRTRIMVAMTVFRSLLSQNRDRDVLCWLSTGEVVFAYRSQIGLFEFGVESRDYILSMLDMSTFNVMTDVKALPPM